MDAKTLYDAIIPVCPIVNTAVPIWDDRSTWSYLAKPEATTEQIAAADNVVATIPIETTSGDVPATEIISRFTNQEYLNLEKKRAADIAANKIGNAKNWDVVFSTDVVNVNRQKVQSLKADLVTDGILTQARADEIFA